MRQRRMYLAAAVAIVSIVSVVATAAVAGDGGDATARLSGFEEVPVISTEGTGKFKAEIRSDRIDYKLSYRDLEGGGVLFAHIHLGQRTANGGVAAFLCGGGGKDPCPPSPATVRGTITPADVVGPTSQGIPAGGFDELVERIEDGVTYANVHTSQFTGGEIRGQINGDEDDDD
jgi:CHRD domain